MRFLSRPLIVTSVRAASTTLCAAADDNAKPAEARDPIAWLGVATAPVDEIVTAQLDLPEGVGAAEKFVMPESPAEAAGVVKNDILFEFAGEAVRSPEHLSELVLGHEPDEEVTLGVIHRGQKRERSVTLGERPEDLPQAAQPEQGAFGGRLNLGDLGGLEFELFPMEADQADLDKRMEKLRQQMEMHFKDMMELDQLGDLPDAMDVAKTASRSMKMSDANGSIEIRSKDGDTHVTAKDPDGEILFDGPANTAEERAKLPEHALAQLEKFEKSSIDLNFEGFRFGKPKMKVPELKPGKELKPEEEPVPPAKEGDGKKIQL